MVKVPQSHPKKTAELIRKKIAMAGPPICGPALWPQFPESHARLGGLDEPRVARRSFFWICHRENRGKRWIFDDFW